MPVRPRVRVVLSMLVLPALLACGSDAQRDAGDEAATRVAADSASRASLARTDATPAPPMALTQERDADLTGDRVPEQLRVTARGPRPESLAVTLTVRDRGGATLYREAWSSGTWLARLDPSVLTPAIADSLVRRRVDDLLGDRALVRAGDTKVDPRAVAWDVAERRWRESHALADTLPLPAEGRDGIAVAARDTNRVRALVAELRRQPSLAWPMGDGQQAIAWSPSERRFVRIQLCCR